MPTVIVLDAVLVLAQIASEQWVRGRHHHGHNGRRRLGGLRIVNKQVGVGKVEDEALNKKSKVL